MFRSPSGSSLNRCDLHGPLRHSPVGKAMLCGLGCSKLCTPMYSLARELKARGWFALLEDSQAAQPVEAAANQPARCLRAALHQSSLRGEMEVCKSTIAAAASMRLVTHTQAGTRGLILHVAGTRAWSQRSRVSKSARLQLHFSQQESSPHTAAAA